MNPEFQRNLYLEFSFGRLIGMPLSLLVIFAFTYAINEHDSGKSMATVAVWLYIFIVLFWGARQAAESIYDELRNRTWDIQKTSAISPWSLAWGKLFGSTLFNWYGGFFCLLVYWTSIPQANSDVLIPYYALVSGVLIQALSLLVALFALRKKQTMNTGISYLFVFFLTFFIFALNLPFDHQSVKTLHWFSFEIEQKLFALISLGLACAWSIVGVYRLLCQELQIRTLPWVWLGFSVFLVVYIQGLIMGNHYEHSPSIFDDFHSLTVLTLIIFFVSASLTYSQALIDTHSPMLPRRLWLYAQQENWQRFLEELPCWFISLMFTLPACFYLTFSFSGQPTEELHFYPLPAFLLTVRDVALILFFNYAPNPKRAFSLSLLYLTFLYWIIPAIFVEAGAEFLAGLFLPLFYDNLGLAIIVAGAQVGLIGYLLFQRWQKTLNLSSAHDENYY